MIHVGIYDTVLMAMQCQRQKYRMWPLESCMFTGYGELLPGSISAALFVRARSV